MAKLVAEVGFNIFKIDFNFYVRNYVGGKLYTGVEEDFLVVKVPDIYVVNGYDGIDNLLVMLGGHNLHLNAFDQPDGGRVTVFNESEFNGTNHWTLFGISLQMTDISAVAQTTNRSDDFKLIAHSLRGNDVIRLSHDDDKASGFSGDDRMFGGGGTTG